MHLRTLAALLVTFALVSAPVGAVAGRGPDGPARAAYPEPKAGLWDYDRYISQFEIGRFRVRPGTGTKPPKVRNVRFAVESAEGKCPKIETRVTVVAKPIALKQAPDFAEGRTRYQWVMAQNTTYDEDYAEHNFGLQPVPVSVQVAGGGAGRGHVVDAAAAELRGRQVALGRNPHGAQLQVLSDELAQRSAGERPLSRS
jgi:hypothetical protein